MVPEEVNEEGEGRNKYGEGGGDGWGDGEEGGDRKAGDEVEGS